MAAVLALIKVVFEDPLPHAIRMSPSCFGFLIQSSHVQPIKSGHVPATSEFPAPSEFPFIALSAQIPTSFFSPTLSSDTISLQQTRVFSPSARLRVFVWEEGFLQPFGYLRRFLSLPTVEHPPTHLV